MGAAPVLVSYKANEITLLATIDFT